MNVKKLMIDFYSKYKNHRIVQIMNKVYSKEYAFPYDYFARKRLRKWKNHNIDTSRKAKVCFIVQDPNVWNKLEPVYDELLLDGRFEVTMLCIPDVSDRINSTYQYFINKGYACIDALGEGDGSWFDLRKLEPDYVFYGKPYNNYLPKQYRTYSVAKYAKVCTMFYGINLSWNFLRLHSRNFYRDVYCCYAVVPEEVEHNKEMFEKSYKEGLQSTKYLGFPAFALFMKQKGKHSESFDFSKNAMRFIWTPRWTTDKSIGGSNFFRYKDLLINYAKKHSDVDFLFRPHPMALDHFVSTGEMTQVEADDFRRICADEANLNLDKQKDYSASFWNASALITDISSVVVEFFLTGKPIVYCEAEEDNQDYLDYFKELRTSFYLVHDEEELERVISQLANGDDPKKELRQDLINKWFGEIDKSSKKIVEDLATDYYN